MSLKDKILGNLENENFHSLTSDDVLMSGPETGWQNATAEEMKQPSKPFIVTLTNNTGSNIANVTFLNAWQSVGAVNDGVTTGVTATYDYPGLTYPQWLKSLQGGVSSQIFSITTISDTASNLRQSYKITTYNFQGQDFAETITPRYNTFQQITTQVDTDVVFYMTAGTQIILANLAAASAITFWFYPYKVASTVATVGTGRTFTAPMANGVPQLNRQPITRVS